MAVILNPYKGQHQAQLGILENGLKSLKLDKNLMSDADFSDMYWAAERHHRDLKLAHLTGKAQDLMVQAERDTKFYNILMKMLCEVKRLPKKKKRDSLKKVHLWYIGNKHTLASGPRFGKTTQRTEGKDVLRSSSATGQRKTPTSHREQISSRSSHALGSSHTGKENKPRGSGMDHGLDPHDMMSTPHHGYRDSSLAPPSEPASSRLSVLGNDFLTSRFMSDLPTSKLSWHQESPLGKSPYDMVQTPTDWDGPDIELQRIAESSLQFHPSHPSVPNSSPQSQIEDSPRSLGSGGSSKVDVGSADMMDFQSEVRRRLSRGQTPTGSMPDGPSHDQSSSTGYGLPKKMVHSIASLVNPHAKLAETEAKKEEQAFRDLQSARSNRSSSRNLPSRATTNGDLSAHIPVLRAVSVNNSRADSMSGFHSFKQDHTYGQEILSFSKVVVKTPTPVKMPKLKQGKLNFVGRSGTALDVRYSAHVQGDMPEHHTREIIQLYTTNLDESNSETPRSTMSPRVCHLVATTTSMSIQPASPSEAIIHSQTLEDFYQTAENYYPAKLPKYRSSRIQSAPNYRIKSGKTRQTAIIPSATARTVKDRKPSAPKQQKLGKALLANGDLENGSEVKTVHQTSAPRRPESAVKLDEVVNMIDQVKDEMNFFKEKLAPSPMPGFRQPASTGVSSKPLSRPTSTASRKSQGHSQAQSRVQSARARSPSPQGRPGTPTERDDLMMGEAEVPADTFRNNALPSRPHSATVNKAVDWRGKVTPEVTKIRSKSRFGGHSYVQKLKPSLRTAGAVSAGKRPKTAPMSMAQRWGTKEKEEKQSELKFPEVKIQSFQSVVSNTPYYPVKQEKKPPPIVTVTECDRNERVIQAAGNTMTQIDDTELDNIMQIQHLLGTSDSRFGSMGSLYLDEDFLRSFNARYATSSALGQTSSSQKEYLSFVGPTPRMAPSAEKSPGRQAARKPDVNQIPEETSVKEDDPLNPAETTEEENQENKEETTQEVVAETTQENLTTDEETLAPPGSRADTRPTTVRDSEQNDSTAQDALEITQEDYEGGIHIEVTAIPAAGRPKTPPSGIPGALQELSKSDTWHYQPDVEIQVVDSSSYLTRETDTAELQQDELVNKPDRIRRPYSADYRPNSHHHHHHHHIHHHNSELGHETWSKSIVKPENYCFQCLPDNMSTKVGRSAGRMPGGAQSPSGQVLRMARKQNEVYKKSPPVRTPPSIPSPHHPLGGRTPRRGQQYSSELEHHARKVKSPRHFMEHVVELRNDNCKSAPSGSQGQDMGDEMLGSLSVISLRVPDRAQTAPVYPIASHRLDNTPSLPSHPEEDEGEAQVLANQTAVSTAAANGRRAGLKTAPAQITNQSLNNIGRPIPQVSNIPDPVVVAEAVLQQKQAKAAVDIQRIFRGYVCRNSYMKLLWENRKDAEDKQYAQIENQKHLKKHHGRMAKIYNRPPLDPALLQWAKDYKTVLTDNQVKRDDKLENTAREMTANQVRAKSKIEVIGPHVEIYDIYHPKECGPSKRDMHKAAVKIQQHARGFLVRRRFEKLKRKAIFCGSTWPKMVKDYKNLLIRVQRWHGVDKPSTPFKISEMYEYMDMRRRYESQFDKKSFAGELELQDLESFFKECDLFPSCVEIEEGLDVINQGHAVKKGLQKQDALNLLYYIYVPPATGLSSTRASTWMNPIINGVEARKLLGGELLEATPLKPCADLVMKSRMDRREKAQAEREQQRQENKDEIRDKEEEELVKRRENLFKFVNEKDEKFKKKEKKKSFKLS